MFAISSIALSSLVLFNFCTATPTGTLTSVTNQTSAVLGLAPSSTYTYNSTSVTSVPVSSFASTDSAGPSSLVSENATSSTSTTTASVDTYSLPSTSSSSFSTSWNVSSAISTSQVSILPSSPTNSITNTPSNTVKMAPNQTSSLPPSMVTNSSASGFRTATPSIRNHSHLMPVSTITPMDPSKSVSGPGITNTISHTVCKRSASCAPTTSSVAKNKNLRVGGDDEDSGSITVSNTTSAPESSSSLTTTLTPAILSTAPAPTDSPLLTQSPIQTSQLASNIVPDQSDFDSPSMTIGTPSISNKTPQLSSSSSKPSSSHMPLIAGLSVGLVLILLIIAAAIIYWVMKHRRRSQFRRTKSPLDFSPVRSKSPADSEKSTIEGLSAPCLSRNSALMIDGLHTVISTPNGPYCAPTRSFDPENFPPRVVSGPHLSQPGISPLAYDFVGIALCK